MVSNIINRLNMRLQKLDRLLEFIFRGRFPPQLCAVESNQFNNSYESSTQPKALSLKDIWGKGILWAVPKKRRSVEQRLNRKYGFPDKNWKLLVPKSNLITCHNCGYVHEAQVLCVHCYRKIKEETAEMQKAIENELGLDPVEKEVIVLYEDDDKSSEFWKNQRIVELPKKRPEWFNKNLLQPTTQEPSDNKEIKSTDLA